MARLKTSLKIYDLVAASERNMNTNIDVSDVISVVCLIYILSQKRI